MADFHATLRQHYKLEKVDLLVLEETYVGDVGPGDELAILLDDGRLVSFRVKDVAWGSSMSGRNPPLTLVVEGLGGTEPTKGSTIAPAA